MTDKLTPEQSDISPELLKSLAATVGVNLTGDRATTLAPQAEQHFAQLRHLDNVASPSIEPAAEIRLDRWTSRRND